MMGKYQSPRWSGEITDCAMPMTFDQYDHCAYNCLYCFSWFQKSLKAFNPLFPHQTGGYQESDLRSVSPSKIDKLFNLEYEDGTAGGQFNDYIRQRIPMQWGGLSDPFDPYEFKHNVGLECLKVLAKHDYPLCFSTKATWWTKDSRYVDLFKGQKNWNTKISIINMNAERARAMEKLVPSPKSRLLAMQRIAGWDCGGVTLRLRPFIIGFSNLDDEYLKLIRTAAMMGASAVSTEFFCLEDRAHAGTKARYKAMSEILGFDVHKFYKVHSPESMGYLRLNLKMKEPYVRKMESLCKELGMRFYVSDAHWKDKCEGGCCCGLDTDWNYFRGQYTEMLVLAKSRKDGIVTWQDMEPHMDMFKTFKFIYASGFNTTGSRVRTKYWNYTMYDWIKEIWNNPKQKKSPYVYFHGLLKPIRVDTNGDVVYQYNPYKEGRR